MSHFLAFASTVIRLIYTVGRVQISLQGDTNEAPATHHGNYSAEGREGKERLCTLRRSARGTRGRIFYFCGCERCCMYSTICSFRCPPLLDRNRFGNSGCRDGGGGWIVFLLWICQLSMAFVYQCCRSRLITVLVTSRTCNGKTVRAEGYWATRAVNR